MSATFTGTNLQKIRNIIPDAKLIIANNAPQDNAGGDYHSQLTNIKKYNQRVEKDSRNDYYKIKFEMLVKVLKHLELGGSHSTSSQQAIIFFNFKMQGEDLARDLKRLHGISSVFIHGDQS